MSVVFFTTFSLSQSQAYVKFKLEAGPGFGNYPQVVKKIENYLNENIGTQLDHDAVVYLKILENPGLSIECIAYMDRSLFKKKCAKGIFNTSMQDAVLNNSTLDSKPHGVIIFGSTCMDLINQSTSDSSLPIALQSLIRHEITHGLGIVSYIIQDQFIDPKAEGVLETYMQLASAFEVQLNEHELKKFCQEVLERRYCHQAWTSFDMHIVDSAGVPFINRATLTYQGIDFLSLFCQITTSMRNCFTRTGMIFCV